MPIQRQYTPVTDSRRYTTHLDSVHEGARLRAVQVSWYPRVQFKVRVFHALVVTGTVPVVLRISWKDVIGLVPLLDCHAIAAKRALCRARATA